MLIHAAGLGVLGAGIASLIPTLLTLPVAPGLLRRIDRTRPPGAGTLAPELGVQWRAGWPMAVAFTPRGGGYAVAGLMLAGLGAAALAANQIVQAVMTVLYMLPLGLATATSLQVGFARGEGTAARLRPVLAAAILTVTVWIGLIIVLLVPGGEAMPDFCRAIRRSSRSPRRCFW